jgi:predicted permease
VIAGLTLALGVGANTAIFSLVDGLLIQPLPYPDPAELVVVWEDRANAGGTARDDPTIADVMVWQPDARAFEGLSYFWPSRPRFDAEGNVVELTGAQLSQNTLDILGVHPAFGRGFLPDETAPGGSAVALLGHGFWVSRFGADPSVVGRTIRLDDVEHLVIGVMPEHFRFVHLPNYSETPDVLTAFQRDPARCTGANQCYRVSVLGRLAEGAGPTAAAQELAALARERVDVVPGRTVPPSFAVVSLYEQTVAQFRPFVLALMTMAAVLLVVACANLTSLVLARTTLRRTELSMRGALGASRPRLVAHLLSEGLLLGVLAGVASAIAAVLTTPLLVRVLAEVVRVPREAELDFDARALAFAFILSIACALTAGAVAAASALRRTPRAGTMSSLSRSSGVGRRSPLLWWLGVAQVASSVVLVVSAGLLYQSIRSLIESERGFRVDDIVTVRLPLTGAEYEERSANLELVSRVSERLRAIPGVEGVAATSSIPLDGDGGGLLTFGVVGAARADGEPAPTARFRGISPEYFDVMGIDVVDGRGFGPDDRADSPRVLVVNAAAARRNWPGQSPVGERIAVGAVEFMIVGLVADVRSLGLDQFETPVLYRPLTQGASDYTTLVIRSDDPERLAAPARALVRESAPRLAGVSVATMREVMHASISPQTVTMRLTAAFSAIALMLAVLGVYGLAGYQVVQETPAIGLRLALGSDAADVHRLVLLRGLRLIGTGVLLGIFLAIAGLGWLESLLYGVSARDPLVLAGSACLVAIVGTLAVHVPARRASRLDPIRALRCD